MKVINTFILLFILLQSVSGQDSIQIKNAFKGTRFVNSQSANLADKGEFMLLIQHRFGDIGGGSFEFSRLDQPLYTQTSGDPTKGSLFFGFNLIRAFNINESSNY